MKRIRKSIEEMLGDSNQGGGPKRGIKCPKCGAMHLPESGRSVNHTLQVDDGVRRYRTCRNCGYSFRTIERRG